MVKKRQISSYCRHILTFSTHLKHKHLQWFSSVVRCLSSLTSMGASSPQTYFDISSTFDLHKQVIVFNGSRALFEGYAALRNWDIFTVVLKTSDIKLLQTYFDIFGTFELHSRPTSSMVLEPSSGTSRPKKQGQLYRWLKNVRYQAIADKF